MNGRFIAVLVDRTTGTHHMLTPFPSRPANEIAAVVAEACPPPPHMHCMVVRAHADGDDDK